MPGYLLCLDSIQQIIADDHCSNSSYTSLLISGLKYQTRIWDVSGLTWFIWQAVLRMTTANASLWCTFGWHFNNMFSLTIRMGCSCFKDLTFSDVLPSCESWFQSRRNYICFPVSHPHPWGGGGGSTDSTESTLQYIVEFDIFMITHWAFEVSECPCGSNGCRSVGGARWWWWPLVPDVDLGCWIKIRQRLYFTHNCSTVKGRGLSGRSKCTRKWMWHSLSFCRFTWSYLSKNADRTYVLLLKLDSLIVLRGKNLFK